MPHQFEWQWVQSSSKPNIKLGLQVTFQVAVEPARAVRITGVRVTEASPHFVQVGTTWAPLPRFVFWLACGGPFLKKKKKIKFVCWFKVHLRTTHDGTDYERTIYTWFQTIRVFHTAGCP